MLTRLCSLIMGGKLVLSTAKHDRVSRPFAGDQSIDASTLQKRTCWSDCWPDTTSEAGRRYRNFLEATLPTEPHCQLPSPPEPCELTSSGPKHQDYQTLHALRPERTAQRNKVYFVVTCCNFALIGLVTPRHWTASLGESQSQHCMCWKSSNDPG